MKSLIHPWALAALFSFTAFTSLCADNVRVIVGFHGNVDAGVFHRLGGAAATRLDAIGAVAGTVPSGKLNALRREPGVSYVEEDLVRDATLNPNDTYYIYSFGKRYENRGYNDQYGDFALINAQQAWDTTTGSGVRVAVLDTGYDTSHPDAGNVQTSRNFTTSGSTTDVTDSDGHGTHTGGTIAGRSNNNRGVASTAWDAELAIGKVLGPQGGYDSWVAAGMLWAVDPNGGGASIVSMSLGGVGSSPTLDNACAAVWAAGGLSIAAAGNDAVDGSNHYPSAHPNVLGVGAVDENGSWASFSNYGSAAEIAAPGVNVLSTFNGGGYGWASGTSMACPHVAGVAALVLSHDTSLNNAQLRDRLVASATLTSSAPDGANVPIVDAASALVPSVASPTVTINAPIPGETVAGTVTVSATAAASEASATISSVEFFVNDVSIGTDPDNTAPYEVSWDTTGSEEGAVTLKAKVTDTNGTGSDAIEVFVDNVNDSPTVTITNPSSGVVSGLVTLSADASDDRGIASVVFYLNSVDSGNEIGPDWDTTSVEDGNYTLIAVATDTNGASASDSVAVTVYNTPSGLAVSSIDPDSISTGTTDTVTISGAGFAGPTSVTALNGSGQAPSFSNVVVVDGNTITATVTVKNGGPPRDRIWDISISSGGDTAVLSAGFTVTVP